MINRTKFYASLCVAALTATAAMGQAVSETKEATTFDKSKLGIFKDASVQIFNRVTINDTERDNKASYTITPHFITPLFNNTLKLDIYAAVSPADSEGINQAKIDGGSIEVIKTLVDNDNVLLEPYLWVTDAFKSTRSIRPTVRTIGMLPIDLGEDGKITPFFYNESYAAFHTNEALEPPQEVGDRRTAIGSTDITDIKNDGPEPKVINVGRAKVNTWTRLGVALTPAAIEGLKLTAGADFSYTFNDPNTVVSDNDLTVNGYKDSFTSSPMVRIEYQVNERIHLRNNSSITMNGFFKDVDEDQKKKMGFTNYTRLIYTLL